MNPKKPTETTSLAAVNPQLAAEWHHEKNGDLSPDDFLPNSKVKVWWRCLENADHQPWEARIQARNRTSGCPDCAREKNKGRKRKSKTLAEGCPSVAAEWHPTKNSPLSPEDVSLYSKKEIWWRCLENPEHDDWEARVDNRVRAREFDESSPGCPRCSGRIATPETSLAAIYPDLAAEWHPTLNGPLTAEQVKPNSHLKVSWLCLRDASHKDWTATVAHRAEKGGKGTGCPKCQSKIATETNCLAIVNPGLVEEWHPTLNGPLTPRDVTPFSNRKVWWRCLENPEHDDWEATIASRNLGVGCKDCSKGGIKPGEPGLLYLVTRQGVVKVGIANATDPSTCRRLREHRRSGFSIAGIWTCDHLSVARTVEAQVLGWWRSDLEIPPALERGKDGWTETASLDLVGLDETVAFIDRHIEDFDLASRISRSPS